MLTTIVFWRSAANYQLLLNVVVCAGALVVAMQAVRSKEYLWAVCFIALALLFNPAVPVFRLSGELQLLLVTVCIAPFAFSLAALKTQPLLTMPSITNRNPGRESL
jgi:hypothetical protein